MAKAKLICWLFHIWASITITCAQVRVGGNPIGEIITRVTLDRIPFGRAPPPEHHVLMDVPVTRVEFEPVEDFIPYEEEEEVKSVQVDPYSSGVISAQQRQQRFKFLRPSSPFSRRRGNSASTSSTTVPPTTVSPDSEGENGRLGAGGLRSRFRFRPDLLSSARRRKNKETAPSSEPSTTNAPTEITVLEESNEKSSTPRFTFKRLGGIKDFIKRNRPSLRKKTTTAITTTEESTTVIITTQRPAPPKRVKVQEEEEEEYDDDPFFDFDTPLGLFVGTERRPSPQPTPTIKTTTTASTISAPFITTSQPELIKRRPNNRKNIKVSRRRRPRPIVNEVASTPKREEIVKYEEDTTTEVNVTKRPRRLRGKKRVKGGRPRGLKNRARPFQKIKTENAVTEPSTTTSTSTTTVTPPFRKLRRNRHPTSRRLEARTDFSPLIYEEQPRSAEIASESSFQNERRILPPRDESSKVFRRDGEVQKRSRRLNTQIGEQYSYEEEDGSFTWGYKSKDGSFKEETRGADCITRGRYGYVDPSGELREFTYHSGVPCNKQNKNEGTRGKNGIGYYDYSENRFVLPDGRKFKVEINQKHRARG